MHLVGHDWGANSGWLVAAHRPELVRSLDRGLGAAPRGVPQGDLRQPPVFSSWYMGAFQTPRLPERLAAKPGGRFDQALRNGGMTQEDVDRFRREIVDYGALTGGAELVPRHAVHRPARHRRPGRAYRPRWCGATATSP